MSINHNARTECVEVLFNPTEKTNLERLCKSLGIGVSTYLRGLGNKQVSLNGSSNESQEESRHCRGAPIANRASAGRRAFARGNSKCSGRGGAGGTHRVMRF